LLTIPQNNNLNRFFLYITSQSHHKLLAPCKGKSGAGRSKQSRVVIKQATAVLIKLTAKHEYEPLDAMAKHNQPTAKQRWQSREGEERKLTAKRECYPFAATAKHD
jgi:hypothetical protein